MIIVAKRVGKMLFATGSKAQAPIPKQSHTIVDPYFYQQTDFVSKIQNYFTNRGALNDIERSFKDFKRKNVGVRFQSHYNRIVGAIEQNQLAVLQEGLSASLLRDYKRAVRNGSDLPFFLERAKQCNLVQARGYSENMAGVKSTDKWFQLIFKFNLVGGDEVYHIVERNDKARQFKFIKFYL